MQCDNIAEEKANIEVCNDSPKVTQVTENEQLKNMAQKEKFHHPLDDFNRELQKYSTSEEKLKFALAFMENAVSQGSSPDFKAFWEVRKVCLDLFKDNFPPLVRSEFWAKFSDLSKQARKLKEVFDEESNFAVEQFEIAVSALEKEIEGLSEMLKSSADLELPGHCRALEMHYDAYNSLQNELHLLNLYASRITALRKELIKTEMRIKTKNRLFERLSKLGDSVFPRRKELIQAISDQFSKDVEAFISRHFQTLDIREPLHILREEIKGLQASAKFLTLNVQAFGETRAKLSECWDKLKEKDTEKKKEFAQKRELFKQNAEALHANLKAIEEKFDSSEAPVSETLEKLDAALQEMRAKELGRDEVRELREYISIIRGKVSAKQELQDQEKHRLEQQRNEKKREAIQALITKAKAFAQLATTLAPEEIHRQEGEILAEIQNAPLNKSEKADVEKHLKPLKEILRQKKEAALRALPSDQRQALDQLRELLTQKKEERQEIKDKLEALRKTAGSSGLDFQRSMEINAIIAEEKVKLEDAQAAVQEIEQKIEELEENLS